MPLSLLTLQPLRDFTCCSQHTILSCVFAKLAIILLGVLILRAELEVFIAEPALDGSFIGTLQELAHDRYIAQLPRVFVPQHGYGLAKAIYSFSNTAGI